MSNIGVRVFSVRASLQLFRSFAGLITLADMSNHPMKNTVKIRQLVSATVGCPAGAIVVSKDGDKRININWPTSMTTPREIWAEAKAKLEQMFPGWSFSYS